MIDLVYITTIKSLTNDLLQLHTEKEKEHKELISLKRKFKKATKLLDDNKIEYNFEEKETLDFIYEYND